MKKLSAPASLALCCLLPLLAPLLHAQPRIDPRHPEFIYFPELGRMIGTQSVRTGQTTVYPVGDVNHDGRADWIMTTRPDTSINGKVPYELRLYRGVQGELPSPESGERIGVSEIHSDTRFLAAGDWDGDTWIDIVVRVTIQGDTSGGNTRGLGVGKVVVFWGSPHGYSLNDTTQLENGEQMWLGSNESISADADNDGIEDIVMRGISGMTDGEVVTKQSIIIYRGHRGGRWGRSGVPRTADWGWWTPPEFRRFTAIDQNCDGAVDLVFHNDINSLEKPSAFSILYGTPGGGLPDTANLMTLDMSPVNGHAALLSDISGDGVPELLISCLDEVMRIYAGEPGVKINEQFGSGDDPPDVEHGRWYRRPWAEVPLPRSMHDGWAYAGSLPPLDLGDANLDGINDIFTRSWPFLIEYNTTVLGEAGGVWFNVLDSMIDGMYRAPEEEIRGTVRVGDIDGSGVSAIAVTFPAGVSFIKPTKALPETGPLRQALNPPGVRCQGVASIKQPRDGSDILQLSAEPNPTTGEVRLRWQRPECRDAVRLRVVDLLGREVAVLTAPAGAESLTWAAGGLAGGRYYVTLTCGPLSATTTVMIVR